MPAISWEAVVNFGAPYQTATSGAAYTASTSITDISAAPQITLPANFYYPGQLLRLSASGIVSTTSAATLILGFYYGGVAGTALGVSATTAGNSTGNSVWNMSMLVRVLTVGSSGTVTALGQVFGAHATSPQIIPATSATGNTVTINTTTANAWTVGATWGTNNASTITVYDFVIEALT